MSEAAATIRKPLGRPDVDALHEAFPGMVTEPELMRIFGKARDTILRWRRQGMPYEKRGTLVLYDLARVREWLTTSHKPDRRVRGRRA